MTSIFDYMDTCLFLQDYYRLRKEKEPTYSYAKWASEVGFSNKTLLRLIVQGQRKITAKSKTAFKKFYQFDELESDYFDLLVEYNQSEDLQLKQALGARLLELNRQKFSQRYVPAGSGILTDPCGPQVMTVVSTSDKPIDIEAIAKITGLEFNRVGTILKYLIDAELIVERKEGYTATQPTFKIADEIHSVELMKYHRYWTQYSISAMDFPPEKRIFRSVNLTVTEEEFQEVIEEINRISVALIAKFKKNSLENRELFLLNLSAFPAKTPNTNSKR